MALLKRLVDSVSWVFFESRRVLPIKDEESGKILNLVFVWVDEGTELKVDVPVVFKGEEDCHGLKKELLVMHDVEFHPSLKLLSKNEIIPLCENVPTYSENPEPMKV